MLSSELHRHAKRKRILSAPNRDLSYNLLISTHLLYFHDYFFKWMQVSPLCSAFGRKYCCFLCWQGRKDNLNVKRRITVDQPATIWRQLIRRLLWLCFIFTKCKIMLLTLANRVMMTLMMIIIMMKIIIIVIMKIIMMKIITVIMIIITMKIIIAMMISTNTMMISTNTTWAILTAVTITVDTYGWDSDNDDDNVKLFQISYILHPKSEFF